MSTLVDLFPPFGLRVVAGPLEMRGLTDDLLLELCDVAERGIHDPDEMPFYFPWSTAPAGELSRNTAAYQRGRGWGVSTRGGGSARRCARRSAPCSSTTSASRK